MADASMPAVPDHDRRMATARAVATWYLGHRSWADNLIGAYLDPEMAETRLRAAKAKYDTPPTAVELQG